MKTFGKATLFLVVVIFIIVVATELFNRVPPNHLTSLEGTWVSNKALTLENINDKSQLSSQELAFLEENLGKLTLTFKTFLNVTGIGDSVAESIFLIAEEDESSVVIVTYQFIHFAGFYFITQPIASFRYLKTKNCITLNEGRYYEYFCRKTSVDL